MKSLFLTFVLTIACVLGQAPAPAPAAPAAPASAAEPKPADEIKMDTVVARMGVKSYTVADIKAMIEKLPNDMQRSFLENPKNALQSLALMEYLSKEAEKLKLADQSPYKEQLEMQRQQVLAQAEVAYHAKQVAVSDEEVKAKFDADKLQYEQAKIRVILLTFLDPKMPRTAGANAPKLATEAEAKARAEELAKKARAGADFAELAKENSEDPSASKGGEFRGIRRADNIPDDIRAAIFAQKPGGITDPVRQGPGYYVIKVEAFEPAKFEDVRDQILVAMKNERQQQWIKGIQKQFEVAIEKPEFFAPPKQAPAPVPTPAVPGSPQAK